MGDPNRPERFLPPRDDFVYGDHGQYFEPERPRIQYQNGLPGQELFDLYNRPPSPVLNLADDSYFYLNISGQIEFADYPDIESLQVKYDIVAGKEWKLVQGQMTGASQFAYKSQGNMRKIVWNFPLSVGFRSTNAKGWPQIVVTCVGPDFMGRHVIKGYGTIHVPTQPGRTQRRVRLYTPKSSSTLVHLIGILKGKLPELINPTKTLAWNEGREVTRMISEGNLTIVFNVSQKNMESFGFSIRHQFYAFVWFLNGFGRIY